MNGCRFRAALPFMVLIGCAPAAAPTSGDPEPLTPPPPWGGEALLATDVPDVYATEWAGAENRESCALLAPADLGAAEGATPRRANFSGGWAVAYDLPQLRSAFGIAGTGASADGGTYRWPFNRTWSDGSTVGYGPEGGTGPNELAYLRIPDQGCLYNIWSRLGREHLEHLIDHLRRVDTPIR